MSSPSIASEEIRHGLLFAQFEKAAKVLAAFTIGLYVLGLIVSNQYLVLLGISDFSSLRPKFVLTGAWVFVMYIFSCLPGLIPLLYVYRFDRIQSDNFWRILGIVVLCIPPAIVLNLAWIDILRQGLNPWAYYYAKTVMIWLVVAAVPWLIVALFPDHVKNRSPYAFVSGVLICFRFLMFSRFMAYHMYCQIPEAYGGGRAVEVKLYFNKDGSRFWKGLDASECTQGRPESSGGTPVYIVYQNDRDVVIGTCMSLSDPNGKQSFGVLTINRNLLDGIVQVKPPDLR